MINDSLTDFLDRKAIASVLRQIAGLLELRGENAFRVRAFETAARTMGTFTGDLRQAIADGSLARIRGIGPVTLGIVTELAETGRASMLEQLRADVPAGLVEMVEGSGLGVAKIRQVHEILGVDSLPELEAAARDGRLATLPRFGPKTAANVLKTIAFRRQASAFQLMHHAADEAESLRAALARLPGVNAAYVAGEVRRRSEVVRELVVVVIAEVAPALLFRRLTEMPGVHEFSGQDERRVTLRFAGGGTAQVIVTTAVNAGAVLVQATGSNAHVRELATHATARGYSLHGAALWHGSEFVATPDESDLYEALGLALVPAELREGRGEVDLAARGALPRLVERADLRGFLHCHTRDSDGSNTVEQIAIACRDAGYEWVGITDHSQAAAYAGGLKPEALLRQGDEIDAVNARISGVRVLKGIEADILQDGRVDYDERVLARLDFVIGSIHSRFALGEREMTARMLAAMDNPYLTIIGHPTGRLLLTRDPYPIDMDAVIERAAARGVALEINADPHRLDLDWRCLGQARSAGAAISIGADAHSLAGIGNMEFGVAMARKGGLRREDLLNAMSADEFV
ncbi:MAG: PHP domain-containing protein, partial [Gemmatimonadota bacterium]